MVLLCFYDWLLVHWYSSCPLRASCDREVPEGSLAKSGELIVILGFRGVFLESLGVCLC